MSLLWYVDILLCIWLNSKIYDEVFLCKVLDVSYKQNTVDNCSALEDFHLKNLEGFSRVIFL